MKIHGYFSAPPLDLRKFSTFPRPLLLVLNQKLQWKHSKQGGKHRATLARIDKG